MLGNKQLRTFSLFLPANKNKEKVPKRNKNPATVSSGLCPEPLSQKNKLSKIWGRYKFTKNQTTTTYFYTSVEF